MTKNYELEFDRRSNAEEVLKVANNIFERKGYVVAEDFCDLMDDESLFDELRVIWRSLDSTKIVYKELENKWCIILPEGLEV